MTTRTTIPSPSRPTAAKGLLWSSAGEAQQYTYVSYLTNTANGPLLTARRDSRDSAAASPTCWTWRAVCSSAASAAATASDGLPDDCFIARQGFDYGLMDSTGQWLYRESIFSSPERRRSAEAICTDNGGFWI